MSKKFGKLTLSTYSSLLTNKKTLLVASIGKCGHEGYREAQITFKNGAFYFIVTDGYNFLGIEKKLGQNLKSALNIIEGSICPTPWYVK